MSAAPGAVRLEQVGVVLLLAPLAATAFALVAGLGWPPGAWGKGGKQAREDGEAVEVVKLQSVRAEVVQVVRNADHARELAEELVDEAEVDVVQRYWSCL